MPKEASEGSRRPQESAYVRALAGAGACCMLGRKGRACLLVSDDRQGVCERLQQVLWALQGPLCTVAGAS